MPLNEIELAAHESTRDLAADLPTSGLADYISRLAKLHGVSYVKTPYDELAEVITRLSDDDVVMDETELLLLALERSGVIPGEAVVPLHVNYLREKFR